MITIASVLRSGGDYDPAYVKRLATGVRRNLSVPYEFVCLSDIYFNRLGSDVDSVIPLKYNWPGWWAKIELFSLSGSVLYLDLDTVVVDSIDGLAKWVMKSNGQLLMLRDFYRKAQSSGILGWNDDMRWILDSFVSDYASNATWKEGPHSVWLITKRKRIRGDQEWLRDLMLKHKQIQVVLAQDIFPGIYSYKVDVRDGESLPDDARIICFHGRPRPHEVCSDLDFGRLWRKEEPVLDMGGKM